MNYLIFFVMFFFSGLGVIYGLYKMNVPIYLLCSGIIAILGILVLSEGLMLGAIQTMVIDGETIVTTPQVVTASNSLVIYLLGYGSLYGGMFLSGLGTIVSILWFWRRVQPGISE